MQFSKGKSVKGISLTSLVRRRWMVLVCRLTSHEPTRRQAKHHGQPVTQDAAMVT